MKKNKKREQELWAHAEALWKDGDRKDCHIKHNAMVITNSLPEAAVLSNLVYWAFLYRKRGEEFFLNQADIASWLRVGKKTVMRAIKKFEDWGIICTEVRIDGNRHRKYIELNVHRFMEITDKYKKEDKSWDSIQDDCKDRGAKKTPLVSKNRGAKKEPLGVPRRNPRGAKKAPPIVKGDTKGKTEGTFIYIDIDMGDDDSFTESDTYGTLGIGTCREYTGDTCTLFLDFMEIVKEQEECRSLHTEEQFRDLFQLLLFSYGDHQLKYNGGAAIPESPENYKKFLQYVRTRYSLGKRLLAYDSCYIRVCSRLGFEKCLPADHRAQYRDKEALFRAEDRLVSHGLSLGIYADWFQEQHELFGEDFFPSTFSRFIREDVVGRCIASQKKKDPVI